MKTPLASLLFTLGLAGSASAATVLVDFNAANDLSVSKSPDGAGNFWNTLTGANGSASYTNLQSNA